MLVSALLLAPFGTGLLCYLLRQRKTVHLVNLLGAALTLATGLAVVKTVFVNGPLTLLEGAVYLDALSAFMILVIILVGFLAGFYSVFYMARELEEGVIDLHRLRVYYFWFYIFISTMLAVAILNNLGLVWAAIEATTLASALLVGFYRKASSLEAAWKYIIICSVGIAFALFGTILTYYSSVHVAGEGENSLNWTTLVHLGSRLDPQMIKLAFIFVLIGYGTKAGLAPMHTWLPDAHSQAPSPASALLSGVLLNCALYAILRFHIIVSQVVGVHYSGNLLLVFGLLSMGLAIPFILLQYDFKRLLAYSSVEHIGIIAAGVGIGGRLGLYGALLHLFNHALTKSMMFLVAGNLVHKYKTKKIARIKGVVQTMPLTGTMLLLGLFAITGSPPFGPFISELSVASGAMASGKFIPAALFLLFIAVIFAGILYYGSKMAFGTSPGKIARGDYGGWSAAGLIVPLGIVLLLGVYIPPFLDNMLQQIIMVFTGGIRP